MSIKKVFVICVREIGIAVCNDWKVSSLAFNDINDAIAWIEKRSDNPRRVDNWLVWVGKNHDYKIVDVDVR